MDNECWLEMDLYWFQGGSAEEQVAKLFDRLTPLWSRNPAARKGLSICVGWLFDMVLYWNGDASQVIPCCQPPTYEAWTYERLNKLIAKIKIEAGKRGHDDFHVALLLMGIETQSFPESACEGWSGRTELQDDKVIYDIEGRWFPEHQEVYDSRFDKFFFGAPVNVPADEKISCSTRPTFGQYFADKLVSAMEATGFDSVVLRDHIFTPAYIRGSRKGRYMAQESREAWTTSIITTLARIKAHRPDFIVIGYSSGTSSVEEWRSHGFDLESVAESGCLDLWITQTWASAWGDYWPAHSMGYTFQLANALVHQAMLAKTPCKHMFLVETFDAWEPWDSIHQYPSKVMWEIWAYSHASVLMPDRKVSRSHGHYVSWMNRRHNLLPERTVDMLVGALNEASSDLKRDPTPGGLCIVYPRASFEASLNEPVEQSRGEEVDDWAAMLIKFGLPVLSITRSEWLSKVDADGFLYPLASFVSDSDAKVLSEKPSLLMGDSSRISPHLRELLGLKTEQQPLTSNGPEAATISTAIATIKGVNGLAINQHRRSLSASQSLSVGIECLGGPVFAQTKNANCWVWETPEWGTPFELHMSAESIESPRLFSIVAEVFGAKGWGSRQLHWTNDMWIRPVCFLFWRYPSGEERILLANLETGVTGNSQFCVAGTINSSVMPVPTLLGAPGKLFPSESSSTIRLGPHKACLCDVVSSSPNGKCRDTKEPASREPIQRCVG